MAAEEIKLGDRSRLAEMKKSLANLPLAERVAHEVRLARELGVTATASEAGSVGRPVERRLRAPSAPTSGCDLHAAVEPTLLAGHEAGQTGDLTLRAAMADVLRASPFAAALNAAAVRDSLKALNADSDLDAAVRRLDPHLTLLATRGEHQDVLAEARSAYARTVFAAADPMKSHKGVGGEPST